MKQPVKIAVIAHALRTAGGLSVGRDLIDGITRIAPENHYLFLIPEGLGYEERCERAPGAEIRVLPEMNIVKRIWHDKFKTPKIIKSFDPDVVLALDSSLGLTNQPRQQPRKPRTYSIRKYGSSLQECRRYADAIAARVFQHYLCRSHGNQRAHPHQRS